MFVDYLFKSFSDQAACPAWFCGGSLLPSDSVGYNGGQTHHMKAMKYPKGENERKPKENRLENRVEERFCVTASTCGLEMSLRTCNGHAWHSDGVQQVETLMETQMDIIRHL